MVRGNFTFIFDNFLIFFLENTSHQSFGTTYEITTLQTCLRDYLSTECAEYKDENLCRKVKHYVKHCPNTKPRKHYYYYNNNGRPEAYQRN